MGLRQYQQSGLQYNQYNGQYNVPPGQAAGRVKDNFSIRMLMSCSIVVYNNGGMGLMAVIIRKSCIEDGDVGGFDDGGGVNDGFDADGVYDDVDDADVDLGVNNGFVADDFGDVEVDAGVDASVAGGNHKVERASELRHIFSPGPNTNQQMVCRM